MRLSSVRTSVLLVSALATIVPWLCASARADESVYVSQPVCQAWSGDLRAGSDPDLGETQIYFNVYDNGIAWANGQVATGGVYGNTCQLLVARDGTANSPDDNQTSVYYAWLSSNVPALYLAGEGRAHLAPNSPSTTVHKGMTTDKLYGSGFAIRNALLLTAIRKKRDDAKAAGCDTLIIHAIGFSRGAEALVATYLSGAPTYGDRPGAANSVVGYITLIDPVNSVGKPSNSSTLVYHTLFQPAPQTDDFGNYRRLQPLHLTTIIKQQEFRKFFQPHISSPTGSTELVYNSGNQLGLTDGTASPPTTLALLRAAGPTRRNTRQVAYINGMHSPWWRGNQLSQFALAEADYAFLMLCQEGVVDCWDYKMNFHDYYAAPSVEGDGNILGGREQRNTPRRWTLLHRIVRGPASMITLTLQSAPCMGLPCNGVDPAAFTVADYNAYNAWRWQPANVVPSEQAAWIVRPSQGTPNNYIDDTGANARTHFGDARTAFLDYFDGVARVCRQQCTPANIGNDFAPPQGVKFYTLFQKQPCATLTSANAAAALAGCLAINSGYTGTTNVQDSSCSGAFIGAW
jgi:hypothetical protein